jgi:hypothetical protein
VKGVGVERDLNGVKVCLWFNHFKCSKTMCLFFRRTEIYDLSQ